MSLPSAAATLQAHVTAAAEVLGAHGIGDVEARLDARLLAQHVLEWDAAQFLTRAVESPPPSFPVRFAALVERRARREPIAYILGTQEFWGIDFEVTPAVLIPRPETELIVETALERLAPIGAPRIADVCTGSGCVAIALALHRPDARIVGSDLSADAIRIAQRNAARHGVTARVRLMRTDLMAGLSGGFDAIVANPPYVPAPDAPGLQPEVRDYEPGLALFAGRDGLDVIARLVETSASRLRPGGLLLFEIGAGQSEAVAGLIAGTAGLRMVALRRDLQALPRTVVAERL
jgi:release factor glutamine methyltransferase